MFKPGQSGNPRGRPTRSDIVTQALIIALNEIDPHTNKKKVRILADKLVEKACEGDVQAANAVMDRVEGKPHQTNENYNHTGVERLSDDELARLLTDRLHEEGVVAGPKKLAH